MKNKPLMYGLIGGLAVLLYFKFGTKAKAEVENVTEDTDKKVLAKIEPKQIIVPFGDPRHHDHYGKEITIGGKPLIHTVGNNTGLVAMK